MSVKKDRSLLAAKLAISRRYAHNAIDSQQPDTSSWRKRS